MPAPGKKFPQPEPPPRSEYEPRYEKKKRTRLTNQIKPFFTAKNSLSRRTKIVFGSTTLNAVLFYVVSYFTFIAILFGDVKLLPYWYRFPILGSVADPHLLLSGSGIRIQRGKHYRRKISPKIINQIFQNDIEKSLKINKQNIIFSITKGFLLLIFQFCIHLMKLYIF